MTEKNIIMKKSKGYEAEANKLVKVCSNYRTKNRNPVYKRAWLILLIAIIIGTIGCSSNTDTEKKSEAKKTPKAIEYIAYDVEELLDEFDEDPLKAVEKYSGMYVKLRGQLLLVHSNGEFLCLTPTDKLQINNIICFIMNKEQLNRALEKETGDIIIVKGQLNEVDKDLGYTLDIHAIE